jgi:hypothetical protein
MSAKARVKRLEQDNGVRGDGWCHCPPPMTPREMNYRDCMANLAPDFVGPITIPRCPVCGGQTCLPVVPIGYAGAFEG